MSSSLWDGLEPYEPTCPPSGTAEAEWFHEAERCYLTYRQLSGQPTYAVLLLLAEASDVAQLGHTGLANAMVQRCIAVGLNYAAAVAALDEGSGESA